MNQQEALLEDSQSQANSSTSSYSEILPRQDLLVQVRKDKPIIMRSIPINTKKTSFTTIHNHTQSKNISITMINSTHANTNLSRSNISAQVYKNDTENSNLSKSSKSIKIQQNQKNQIGFNQKLVKSTYQKYNEQEQNLKSIEIGQKKQEQTSKQQFQNVALDFSMSSMNSQKQQILSPKQPFKMIFDSTPKRQGQQQNQQQVKQYIQAIKDLRRQQQKRVSPVKSQKSQGIHIQSLIKKNQQLETRIKQLQDLIKNQSQSKIIQRKANQIYTQFYHTLSKMITKFIAINKQSFSFGLNQSIEPLNESLNMQKILITVQKLIQTFTNNSNKLNQVQNQQVQTDPLKAQIKQTFTNQQQKVYVNKLQQLQKLVQQAQHRNSQLRNQLLQSTQNNINTIFNTQISATCCLQNQVTKIHSQMNFLKQKMNLLLLKQKQTVVNPQPISPQIIYLPQPTPIINPFSQKKQNKIIKIYTTKSKINQSSDQSQMQQYQNKKRRHSLSKKRKKSTKRSRSQSSISSKQTKKRQQMSRVQIQNLKQAYKQTKNQLNTLISTFSLITNSQHQMKQYFNLVKQQIIRNLNDKVKQNQSIMIKKQYQTFKQFKQLEIEKLRQLEIEKLKLRQLQKQQIKQYQLKLEQNFKIKQKQNDYHKHLEIINNERLQDRKVIENLNLKIIQLINTISVPQRLAPQTRNYKSDPLHDDQIPVSQISISVDYLKFIEQLKSQKQKLSYHIQTLNKQNQSLKSQIMHLKNIQLNHTKNLSIKNINNSPNTPHSPSSSRSRRQSIINQLNGFTQMSLPPPLVSNADQNYTHQHKNQFKSNKHVVFNNLVTGKNVISLHKIDSQKIVHIDSHKNLQNNFKVILQSKQSHIKNLQQQILNQQEMIQFLKNQITSKQTIIQDLQNYVLNLQNRSINSISLSSPGINLHQPNLYLDTEGLSENIKNKYENYVKNLKILLKQTRNQNKILKQKLNSIEIQPDQLTQSNFGLKNSATHSERTTKNFPNSSSPAHVKAHGEIVIRKRVQNTQKYQLERQQQRINSLAFDIDLPQDSQRFKPRGK